MNICDRIGVKYKPKNNYIWYVYLLTARDNIANDENTDVISIATECYFCMCVHTFDQYHCCDSHITYLYKRILLLEKAIEFKLYSLRSKFVFWRYVPCGNPFTV